MSRFWASVLIDQARAHTSRSMAPPSISPRGSAVERTMEEGSAFIVAEPPVIHSEKQEQHQSFWR